MLKTPYCVQGYLQIYVLLNILLIMTYYLSVYLSFPDVTLFRSNQWTITNLNHPIMGYIIVMHVGLTSFSVIAPHVWCYLNNLACGPNIYMCIVLQVIRTVILLGGRIKWHDLHIFNRWHILLGLLWISTCVTNTFQFQAY